MMKESVRWMVMLNVVWYIDLIQFSTKKYILSRVVIDKFILTKKISFLQIKLVLGYQMKQIFIPIKNNYS